MNTLVTPAADAGTPRAARGYGRYLYFGVAVGLAIVVFLAFSRTFWTPLAAGTLALHPAIVVHAVLFFVWMLFFVAQTALPLTGRTALHRDLGLLGIALAAVMVFSGILAQIVNLKVALPGPRPDVALTGAVLGMTSMPMFAAFIALGIANIRKSERHKRFMVLATFSILQAAIARAIMLFPAITLPQRVLIGTLVVDAMLLTVILLDARAHRAVHPVYVWGGATLVVVQVLRSQLLQTDAWLTFATWLASIGS